MAKKKEKSNQDHAATSNTKVAMLGAGKMGGILLQAFLNKGLFRPENIRATVQHPERAAATRQAVGSFCLHRQPCRRAQQRPDPAWRQTADRS